MRMHLRGTAMSEPLEEDRALLAERVPAYLEAVRCNNYAEPNPGAPEGDTRPLVAVLAARLRSLSAAHRRCEELCAETDAGDYLDPDGDLHVFRRAILKALAPATGAVNGEPDAGR